MVYPTRIHQEWADLEIGVIIHLDMFTFVPEFRWDHDWDHYPPAETFAPDALSTDQWLCAAASAGAKYAVMVAKHCSGFCLWPTKYHDYHIGNTPYKEGKGDIIREFIDSCKKYGIRPGLYYSANANTFLGMNPKRLKAARPDKQKAYYDIVMGQLRELWTEYGSLFEIWFDGGVIPVSEGGPDIAALLHQLQPAAIVFQGPPGRNALIRWVGNERAAAAENCSAIVQYQQESFDGTEEHTYAGDINGNLWCPGESDTPNRDARRAFQGGWFWHEGEEDFIFSGEELFAKYLTSVGRNTNLLIGMGIDRHGLFPKTDAQAFRGFGSLVAGRFAKALHTETPIQGATRYTLPVPAKASYLVLMEDIAYGERVTGFTVTHERPSQASQTLLTAQIIGHKRIIPLHNVEDGALTLTITSAKAAPQMRSILLY